MMKVPVRAGSAFRKGDKFIERTAQGEAVRLLVKLPLVTS